RLQTAEALIQDDVFGRHNKAPDIGRHIAASSAVWKLKLLFELSVDGIELFNHSPCHEPTLVFRNDHLVSAGGPYRLCVTLLAGAGDDLYVRIERPCRDSNVEVIGVIIYDDADSTSLGDARHFQDIVPLGIALHDKQSFLQ